MRRLPIAISVSMLIGSGTAPAVPRTVVFRDGVSPAADYAGTVDITLSSDTTGVTFAPDANYSSDSPLLIDGFRTDVSALLRFDLTTLPPGTPIERIQLAYNVTNTGPASFRAYACLRPWTPSQVTWLEASPGVPWAVRGARSAGVDRGVEVVARLTGTTLGARVAVFEDAGVSMVQRWVDLPDANFGFIVDDTLVSDSLGISSSEAPTLANRPRLEVTHGGGTVTSFQNALAPTALYLGASDTSIGTDEGVTSLDGQGLWSASGTTFLVRFDLSRLVAGAQVLSAELLLQAELPSRLRTVRGALVPWTEVATWTERDGVTA
jgi:hypothetical protein